MTRIMRLRTVHVIRIRQLLEMLGPLLSEASFVFKSQGVYLRCLTDIFFIDMQLTTLEQYECKRQCIVGIEMASFFSCLRSVTQNDVLELSLNEETFDCSTPTMQVSIETNEGDMYRFSLRLLALGCERFDIPVIPFQVQLSLPSAKFQSYIKSCMKKGTLCQFSSRSVEYKDNMYHFLYMFTSGDYHRVEIRTLCSGQAVNLDGTKRDTPMSPKCDKMDLYELKYLQYLCKVAHISPHVHIYLSDEYPLVLQFNVGSMGTLTMSMVTKTTRVNTVCVKDTEESLIAHLKKLDESVSIDLTDGVVVKRVRRRGPKRKVCSAKE
jgi:hypothetical protein